MLTRTDMFTFEFDSSEILSKNVDLLKRFARLATDHVTHVTSVKSEILNQAALPVRNCPRALQMIMLM